VTFLAATVFVGCSRPATDVPPSTPKPSSGKSGKSGKSGEAALDVYALVRAGAAQMSGAIDSIAEALEQAKKCQGAATGDLIQAFDEVVDRIDGVGGALADFAVDPAPRADFEKNVAAEDEPRLAAIQAGNDGIHELKEAAGIAESVIETVPSAQAEDVKKLVALVDLAVQDVSDAITAFGGAVEPEGQ